MIPHSRPTLDGVDAGRLRQLLDTGQVARGDVCRRLETAFGRQILGDRTHPSRYRARSVQSGTAALHLALLALKNLRSASPREEPALEVVTTSLACPAVVQAVRAAQARPVFVDTDPNGNLRPDAAVEKISPRTLAFLVPHLYGRPVDLGPILATGIPAIEDCAHALAVRGPSGTVGTAGDVMTTSLYATKLVCAGQGGIVASRRPEIADEIDDLSRCDGREGAKMRWNYDLSDWAAALALPQIESFSGFLERRRSIAERYTRAFEPYRDVLVLPEAQAGCEHAWYRYVVLVPENSDPWIARLGELGIEAKRPVHGPLPRLFGFDGEFSSCEDHWRRSLSLPVYPSLTDDEADRLVEAFRQTAEALVPASSRS